MPALNGMTRRFTFSLSEMRSRCSDWRRATAGDVDVVRGQAGDHRREDRPGVIPGLEQPRRVDGDGDA
ncbi:hypothetical protein GCM10010348_47190 [Streptomyces anthocyanicus]|nr:hypothetical protein GCM10010348_47190 [Streptomyces anthocyanicus]